MNPLHLTGNLLRPILILGSCGHAGEIDGILQGLHAYLGHRLERTVRCKMRLHSGRNSRVVDIVPRGLGIRLTADGEKNRGT